MVDNNSGTIPEMEKSKSQSIVKIIGYATDAIVSIPILKKVTGSITLMSFAPGKVLAAKTTPFDTFVQIIDGAAEIIIAEKAHQLESGEGILIPAHAAYCFNAKSKFKLISTVIKSGYEE